MGIDLHALMDIPAQAVAVDEIVDDAEGDEGVVRYPGLKENPRRQRRKRDARGCALPFRMIGGWPYVVGFHCRRCDIRDVNFECGSMSWISSRHSCAAWPYMTSN